MAFSFAAEVICHPSAWAVGSRVQVFSPGHRVGGALGGASGLVLERVGSRCLVPEASSRLPHPDFPPCVPRVTVTRLSQTPEASAVPWDRVRPGSCPPRLMRGVLAPVLEVVQLLSCSSEAERSL